MKKILILVNEYPPVTGGIAVHAFFLAAALAKRQQVQVVTFGQDAVVQEGVKVTLIKPSGVYLFNFLKRFFGTWRVMRTLKPDVVLVSNKFPIWLGWFLSFVFPKTSWQVVLHGNELLQSNVLLNWFTNRALHRFNRLIAVSAYTRSLLQDKKLRVRCEIIHNALPDFWLQNGIEPKIFSDKLSLLTVGTVRKRKGAEWVIRALPALRLTYPQITYTLCGLQQFPQYTKELENLAKQLKVWDCIKMVHIPFGDTAQMQALYRDADMYLLLSQTQPDGDTEGFGISILEANAMGTPAIGAKGCGIADAIHPDENGLLVNARKTEEVVNAVKQILRDYPRFSQGAIQTSKLQSWNNRVTDYEKHF